MSRLVSDSCPLQTSQEAVDRFLRPVRRRLLHEDLDGLREIDPAVRFDPVVAAGGEAPQTRWDAAAARAVPPPAVPPPGDADPAALSVAQLQRLLRSGRCGAAQVIDAHLKRIDAVDPRVGAFLLVLRPSIEAAPPHGALAGIPFGVKDVIETAGVRTTAGSRLFREHVPSRDADVVASLKRSGGVLLGKLHTTEFAASATGNNEHTGPARNPWNPEHLCGGSSSGSAAAVAARMLPVALGSDTGGSIRIPAACCGVVGLRPTFGRVSRRGIFPLSYTHDTAGPLCRTVRDAAIVLGVLENDASSGYESAGTESDVTGLRVGVPRAWLDSDLDPDIRAVFDAAVAAWTELGCDVADVVVPPADDLFFVNRAIAYADGASWHLPHLRSGPGQYGNDVRPRKEAGLQLSAVDYINAQRIRTRYCTEFLRLWDTVDVLFSPTTPIAAPRIGAASIVTDAISQFTGPISLLGYPAISIPAGLTAMGLPVGVQIVAPPHRERRLLRAASALESALSFAGSPPL